MNLTNLAILIGVASITLAVFSPVEAAWYANNRGSVSGWGSSGWGSSGYGGSASTSTGSSSSSSTGSTSGGSTGSSGGTPVPEPSNLLMLGLGIAGVVAGRMVAIRRRKKP